MVDSKLVIDFLLDQGWKETEGTERFHLLKPPEQFGFPSEHRYRIPRNKNSVDYERYMRYVLGIFADLHQMELNDLVRMVSDEKEVPSEAVPSGEEKPPAGPGALGKISHLAMPAVLVLLSIAAACYAEPSPLRSMLERVVFSVLPVFIGLFVVTLGIFIAVIVPRLAKMPSWRPKGRWPSHAVVREKRHNTLFSLYTFFAMLVLIWIGDTTYLQPFIRYLNALLLVGCALIFYAIIDTVRGLFVLLEGIG